MAIPKKRRSAREEQVIHALEQALDIVVAPGMREQILQDAFERSSDVPVESGERLAQFIGGPLREALCDVVGDDAAGQYLKSVSDSLRPGALTPSDGVQWGTMRAAAAQRKTVHLVTTDDDLAAALSTRLEGSVAVQRSNDIVHFLKLLELNLSSGLMLVVDGRHKTPPKDQVWQLEQALPSSARVLLVGETPELLNLRGLPRTWVSVAKEATAEEIAWLCQTPVAEHPDERPTPVMGITVPRPEATPAGAQLLLVDDDERYCRGVARYLRRAGYDVVTASSGREALDRCTKSRPDLIITGLWMPGMNGLQLSNAVQLVLGVKSPPIVLVTGAEEEGADTSPVSRVLRKPVSAETLVEVVAELTGDEPQSG